MNNSIKKAFSFLAIGKVQESKEPVSIKRYYGIAPCKIVAVNPTREEIAKLQNRDVESVKEPVYVGSFKDSNNVEHQTATVVVWFKPIEEVGIDTMFQARFTIQNNAYIGSTSGKKQIIDKYGNTGWATDDEIKEHKIPMYSNGPANMDSDYRIAYRGEEDLVNFLRNFLMIDGWKKYINDNWVLIDNPEDAEIMLEKISDYFKGDFSEIKNAINLMPNNIVKIFVGVKNNDGNLFNTVYTKAVLKNNASEKVITKAYKELEETQARGSYANTTFSKAPLAEYTVTATDFTKEPASSLPFGNDTVITADTITNTSNETSALPF